MLRISLLAVIVLALLSACQTNPKASLQTDTSATHQVAIAIPVPFDTALARSFLMEAIENCFNKRNGKYEAIVTKRYGKLLEDGYDLLNMEMNGNES